MISIIHDLPRCGHVRRKGPFFDREIFSDLLLLQLLDVSADVFIILRRNFVERFRRY